MMVSLDCNYQNPLLFLILKPHWEIKIINNKERKKRILVLCYWDEHMSTRKTITRMKRYIYVTGILNLQNKLKQANLGDFYCYPSTITPLPSQYQHHLRLTSSSRTDPGGECKGCAPGRLGIHMGDWKGKGMVTLVDGGGGLGGWGGA